MCLYSIYMRFLFSTKCTESQKTSFRESRGQTLNVESRSLQTSVLGKHLIVLVLFKRLGVIYPFSHSFNKCLLINNSVKAQFKAQGRTQSFIIAALRSVSRLQHMKEQAVFLQEKSLKSHESFFFNCRVYFAEKFNIIGTYLSFFFLGELGLN